FFFFHTPPPPQKGVIGDIGSGTRPSHDQPPLIQQETEFPPDNPAMVGEAFAADLPGAAAFADGMDQLNAVGVNDAEYGRSGQEDLRPVVMRREEPKEPGALGQAGKQRPIVARQPAIEGPVAHAFQRMQQPQGDHLTGPEVGFGVFGDGAQLLIDLVEQGGDKIEGNHGLLRSWQGVTLSTSVEEVNDHDNKTSKYYRVIGLSETNTICYYQYYDQRAPYNGQTALPRAHRHSPSRSILRSTASSIAVAWPRGNSPSSTNASRTSITACGAHTP